MRVFLNYKFFTLFTSQKLFDIVLNEVNYTLENEVSHLNFAMAFIVTQNSYLSAITKDNFKNVTHKYEIHTLNVRTTSDVQDTFHKDPIA